MGNLNIIHWFLGMGGLAGALWVMHWLASQKGGGLWELALNIAIKFMGNLKLGDAIFLLIFGALLALALALFYLFFAPAPSPAT